MAFNIPKSDKKRVVIVGGGFGGLKLANKLKNSDFQVVLIDRNNYHQFPPLIYQVASAGIEPSSISFPFRKLFHGRKDFYFRMAEVRSVFTEQNILQTSIGKISYDYLVFAAGTTTNFFGNKNVEEHAIPMKNVSEAMGLRNALLENFERALTCSSETERQELLNVVIVGGGATGVEVAGALSEMKNFVLPKDYPDMPSSLMNIYLIEAGPRLLPAMSPPTSAHVESFLPFSSAWRLRARSLPCWIATCANCGCPPFQLGSPSGIMHWSPMANTLSKPSTWLCALTTMRRPRPTNLGSRFPTSSPATPLTQMNVRVAICVPSFKITR